MEKINSSEFFTPNGLAVLAESNKAEFSIMQEYLDAMMGMYYIPEKDYLESEVLRLTVHAFLKSAKTFSSDSFWAMTVIQNPDPDNDDEIRTDMLIYEAESPF